MENEAAEDEGAFGERDDKDENEKEDMIRSHRIKPNQILLLECSSSVFPLSASNFFPLSSSLFFLFLLLRFCFLNF